MILRQWYSLFRYTAAQKFGTSTFFLKKVFMLIKKKTLILWNIIANWNNNFLFYSMLKCNLFLWSKAEFSASLLQSSLSRDPTEINNQCWKQLSCLMSSGPMWSFFHYSLINKKVTKKCLFKLEMLCYIIDYYSKVWGQQFHFLNKLILLFIKDVIHG